MACSFLTADLHGHGGPAWSNAGGRSAVAARRDVGPDNPGPARPGSRHSARASCLPPSCSGCPGGPNPRSRDRPDLHPFCAPTRSLVSPEIGSAQSCFCTLTAAASGSGRSVGPRVASRTAVASLYSADSRRARLGCRYRLERSNPHERSCDPGADVIHVRTADGEDVDARVVGTDCLFNRVGHPFRPLALYRL